MDTGSKKNTQAPSRFGFQAQAPPVRIVLVEDEKIIALDIQRGLKQSGFAVVGNPVTARDALDQVNVLHPDIVIMDIILGGESDESDGIAVAEKIRELHDIPVIFLTARMDETTVQRAAAVQPYGYILKPFSIKEIVIAIKIAVYRHGMERKFREDSSWLTTILSSIGDAILATDVFGRVNFMNDAAKKLTNRCDEDFLGEKMESFLTLNHSETNEPYPDPVNTLMSESRDQVTINEAIMQKSDGQTVPVDCKVEVIHDCNGNPQGAVIILRDVTDRVQADRWMRFLAFHDILTGLPNRAWLYNQLKSVITTCSSTDEQRIGIMFIDLDDFKEINDCFGHDVGDELLSQVAERLKKSVRTTDVVGRLAGDEFIVILDRIANIKDVEKVAQNIVREFQNTFSLAGTEREITMSIGISIYPDDDENLEKLIKHADSAMYRAKQGGKNQIQFFSDHAIVSDVEGTE